MTEPKPVWETNEAQPDARELVALVCYLGGYEDVEPWDVDTPQAAARWWARFALKYNGIALRVLGEG